MTSNPTIKIPLRNNPPANNAVPTPENTYRPSVPISVYRELAAELQTAQAMLESLNSQNQHLAFQNQQLRQEIEKVVQSHLHLQQVVSSTQSVSRTETVFNQFQKSTVPLGRSQTQPTHSQIPVASPQQSYIQPESDADFSDKVVIEQEEGRYRRPSAPENTSDVNGWFLVIAIFLIVATAFGTGFLIVRPLLNK